ncbi:MAG: hypothetical protein ACK5WZ_10525, partial [Pseudobdellovibrionaceae bacterium]
MMPFDAYAPSVSKTRVILMSLALSKCFCSSVVTAQTSSGARPSPGQTTLKLERTPSKIQKDFNTTLRFESMEYLSTIP